MGKPRTSITLCSWPWHRSPLYTVQVYSSRVVYSGTRHSSGFTHYCPANRATRHEMLSTGILLLLGLPLHLLLLPDILKVDFLRCPNFSFEILRKKKWKNITKNHLSVCEKFRKKTVKEVSINNFLVCVCKKDLAQSQKNFARLHDRETLTFRNSASSSLFIPYIFFRISPDSPGMML